MQINEISVTKGTTEVVPLTWIFTDAVATITNAVVTVTTVSGTDATPSALLSGSTIITNVSPYQVVQMVHGGLDGCLYKFLLTTTFADSTVNESVVYLPVAVA